MRLTELKTLSPYERQIAHLGEWDTIITLMRKRGFEEAGEGRFARVFYHPSRDVVIKVFKSADAEYLKWVDFCHANRDNPFCPKVGNPVKLSRRYSFVRIETLDLLQTEEDQLFVYSVKDQIAGRIPLSDDPHLGTIISWIKRFHLDDITYTNIMKRGEQYVFTDPV